MDNMDEKLREESIEAIIKQRKSFAIVSFCLLGLSFFFVICGLIPAEDVETGERISPLPMIIVATVDFVAFLILFILSKRKIKENEIEKKGIEITNKKKKMEEEQENARIKYLEKCNEANKQIDELNNKISEMKALQIDDIAANVTLAMKCFNMNKIEPIDLIKQERYKKLNDEETSINETYKLLCNDYNQLIETNYFYMNNHTNLFQFVIQDNKQIIKTRPISFNDIIDFDIREKTVDLSNTSFNTSVGGSGIRGDYGGAFVGGVHGNSAKVSSENYNYSLITIKTKNKDFPVITIKVLDEQEMLKLKSYLELIKNDQSN